MDFQKTYGTIKPVNNNVYVHFHEEKTFRVSSRLFDANALFGVFVLFYVFFLASGGVIFGAMERPMEERAKMELTVAKRSFYNRYPNVLDEDLENLISEIVRASNKGITATRNGTHQQNWSFAQSLFFSTTVVTTIGYGHVTPLSRCGKIFCIAYAMCGIPLTLVLMSAAVERLSKLASKLLQFMDSKLSHRFEAFKVRIMHLFVIVSIVVIFLILIPSVIFATIEPEWDFMDSFYYCFISLTTIGLGDYIPGDSPNQSYRELYKVATTAYLLVGLTFMMLTLSVFYDIPQLNIGMLFKSNADQQTSEKSRLSSFSYGLQYGLSSDSQIRVVKVKSRHRDDSPSPEESQVPINEREEE